MPDPGTVQPTTIEWVKTISKYLAVPMFAISLKFFIDFAEKSAEDADKERRLQSCETGLIAVNSDVDGNRRRIEAHDQRFDKITERVDKVYTIVAEK
jgi:hypothetical protein